MTCVDNSKGNADRPFAVQGFKRLVYEIMVGMNVASFLVPVSRLMDGKPFLANADEYALWVANAVFGTVFALILFKRK